MRTSHHYPNRPERVPYRFTVNAKMPTKPGA
jgi:hypothetical protein